MVIEKGSSRSGGNKPRYKVSIGAFNDPQLMIFHLKMDLCCFYWFRVFLLILISAFNATTAQDPIDWLLSQGTATGVLTFLHTLTASMVCLKCQ